MIKQYNITDYIKDDPELQKAVIEEFLNDIKRLQTENERLKSRQITKNGFICDCEQNVKYKQALEEIKEYLQQFKKKKSSFYTLNDVITNIANNIEKIISEVLG